MAAFLQEALPQDMYKVEVGAIIGMHSCGDMTIINRMWGHVGPHGATLVTLCDMDITQQESQKKAHGHMTVQELILDPVDFGAPTHRRRRFMVAMHQGYARWRLPGMTWRRALLPFLRRTSLSAADCTTPPSTEASRAYQFSRSFTMFHCMCAHGEP